MGKHKLTSDEKIISAERFNKYQLDYSETHKKERREYHFKNKTRFRDRKRNAALKHSFGITLDDYNKMFNNQNGKCAICGKHQTEFKEALSVDHCHRTGKIRGLLCKNCNTALGLMKDNSKLLFEALRYLTNNSNRK